MTDAGVLLVHAGSADDVVNEDETLLSVAELFCHSRKSGARHVLADRRLIEAAYRLIESGRPLPEPFAGIPRPGSRSHQTLIAVTNAGPCHLRLTSLEASLLTGVLVHVEHIDRSDASHSRAVEPYRIPNPRDAARVRLHIGNSAPCSIYIGSPVFQENFHDGFLKATHSLAATCTAFFQMGYAECKISCVGLKASEAIRLMQTVSECTIRQPQTQILSAAFNLNTPLIDDTLQPAVEHNSAFDIARRSIELVKLGGFNKITWDSAGNSVPSFCIFELLSHRALVELTHLAHSRGLETYVSGGVSARTVVHGVNAGVGGIGIGTSLHSIDESGRIGSLLKDPIANVIRERNRASRTDVGKLASLLAHADRDYADGVVNPLIEWREALFAVLARQNPADASSLLSEIQKSLVRT